MRRGLSSSGSFRDKPPLQRNPSTSSQLSMSTLSTSGSDYARHMSPSPSHSASRKRAPSPALGKPGEEQSWVVWTVDLFRNRPPLNLTPPTTGHSHLSALSSDPSALAHTLPIRIPVPSNYDPIDGLPHPFQEQVRAA